MFLSESKRLYHEGWAFPSYASARPERARATLLEHPQLCSSLGASPSGQTIFEGPVDPFPKKMKGRKALFEKEKTSMRDDVGQDEIA